eukprot:scaffold114500_cov72-Phaeocystis_antarctica.AAC.4
MIQFVYRVPLIALHTSHFWRYKYTVSEGKNKATLIDAATDEYQARTVYILYAAPAATAHKNDSILPVHERLDVRAHAALQHGRRVAALEHGDEPSPADARREVAQLRRAPSEVILGEARPAMRDAAERVIGMRVEAGAHEDHLGPMGLQPRQHLLHKGLAEGGRASVTRHGAVEHIGRSGGEGEHLAVGEERKLLIALQVDGGEEHLLVARKDLLGAVTVVHVEVDDGDAPHAMLALRVTRADGDVVDETEALPARLQRRAGAPGVVAGRTHRAEGVGRAAPQHAVDCEADGARRAAYGEERVGGEEGLAIGLTAWRACLLPRVLASRLPAAAPLAVLAGVQPWQRVDDVRVRRRVRQGPRRLARLRRAAGQPR